MNVAEQRLCTSTFSVFYDFEGQHVWLHVQTIITIIIIIKAYQHSALCNKHGHLTKIQNSESERHFPEGRHENQETKKRDRRNMHNASSRSGWRDAHKDAHQHVVD
eukprot:gene25199-biopygen10471